MHESEIIEKGMDKLIFAILPYGTGCDTSSVFGWGRDPGSYDRSLEVLA